MVPIFRAVADKNRVTLVMLLVLIGSDRGLYFPAAIMITFLSFLFLLPCLAVRRIIVEELLCISISLHTLLTPTQIIATPSLFPSPYNVLCGASLCGK